MTQAQQDTQRRDKELRQLAREMNYIESGKADHLFADTETKEFVLADLEAQMDILVNAEVDANPGIYKRNPDGTISLLLDSERQVIPLSR
jgi:hypothetical protein